MKQFWEGEVEFEDQFELHHSVKCKPEDIKLLNHKDNKALRKEISSDINFRKQLLVDMAKARAKIKT